nr:RES family NAD+ phosphorylase [Leifsonia psychrotolerans]
MHLASLMGLGLHRLGLENTDVTDTPASTYGETVLWAAAAHGEGFDGIAYMSKKCNTDTVYVLFGDKVEASDFEVDPTYAWIFGDQAAGEDKLIDLCAVVKVEVNAT